MASKNGHTTIVDILLNRGANPNIANDVNEVFPNIAKKVDILLTFSVLVFEDQQLVQ